MAFAKVLQLMAVGEVSSSLLKKLEQPFHSYLGLSSKLHRTVLQTPKYAFNKDRNQYHTNAILKRLVPLLEGPSDVILAISDVDLFIPDAAFVFGEADRELRVGILSTFRMKGSDEQMSRRFQVEAVHQAGHLMGLSYCEDARCVMFMAQGLPECDRKNLMPCSLCRNELAKLQRVF